MLSFVPKQGEREVMEAFTRTSAARRLGHEAREVADRYFFETVVRIHRAGEGAPYTGLKPAGLDQGRGIPVAERAIATGSSDELVALLTAAVSDEIQARLGRVVELKRRGNGDIDTNREYVEAMLGLEVWSHALDQAVKAHPHEHAHDHEGRPETFVLSRRRTGEELHDRDSGLAFRAPATTLDRRHRPGGRPGTQWVTEGA